MPKEYPLHVIIISTVFKEASAAGRIPFRQMFPFQPGDVSDAFIWLFPIRHTFQELELDFDLGYSNYRLGSLSNRSSRKFPHVF